MANYDDLKLIKIISLCYCNKDEFFESTFFKKLSCNNKLSYHTCVKIENIFYSNQTELRNREERYHFNHLYELIKEKKYKKIKDELDGKFGIDHQESDTLKTPLMIASQYGINDKKLFDLLMKYNPNKDLLDKTKSTALHIACKYNNSEIISYLITEKNINMKDINDQTPLMIAIEEKNYECIKILLSDNYSKYNVDINIKDNNGNFPLVNTILKFKDSDKIDELIDLLVKRGADKDEINHDKLTALHIACKYNDYKLIPKLITKNNINMKDINGKTPLMIKIEEKNYECIKILLSDDCDKYNIDVNIKDNNGNSSLVNTLIKFNNSDKINKLIDLLIKRGANKDEINSGKATPLHVACQYNLYNSIPKLITENNISLKNKKNQTPIMIACNGQKIQCIEKLMTNELFIKNYKVSNNNNELNILLLLLQYKIENDKTYEEIMKGDICFGLKQFKKNLNIIINNKSFIREIIKNGFYIHKDNKRENIKTPLIFSIINNFKELTKSILNCYDKYILETDENNKYCLFYAIDNKDEEYFDLLMKSKKLILKRIMVKEKQH